MTNQHRAVLRTRFDAMIDDFAEGLQTVPREQFRQRGNLCVVHNAPDEFLQCADGDNAMSDGAQKKVTQIVIFDMRNGYPLIDEIPMPTVDDAFSATMLGFVWRLVHTESTKEMVEAPFHFTDGLFVISDEEKVVDVRDNLLETSRDVNVALVLEPIGDNDIVKDRADEIDKTLTRRSRGRYSIGDVAIDKMLSKYRIALILMIRDMQ